MSYASDSLADTVKSLVRDMRLGKVDVLITEDRRVSGITTTRIRIEERR